MRAVRTITFFLILLIAPASGLAALEETRIAGVFTWEWDEKKNHIREIHQDEMSLRGLDIEIKKEYLGFGISSLIDFEEREENLWFFNWQGQIFIRYHLLGNSCLLDPFLEGSYGNFGTSAVDSSQETELSLVPAAGAGLNLLLQDGFFLGSRLVYRVDSSAIPVSEVSPVDSSRWQASLFAGVRLGSQDRQRRRYYDRYFQEY